MSNMLSTLVQQLLVEIFVNTAMEMHSDILDIKHTLIFKYNPLGQSM